jgi:hypothetical protein
MNYLLPSRWDLKLALCVVILCPIPKVEEGAGFRWKRGR